MDDIYKHLDIIYNTHKHIFLNIKLLSCC